MSATQSLRRLTSLDRAKELAMTGRRFDGKKALQYGLATEVTESPVEDALAMALDRLNWRSSGGCRSALPCRSHNLKV